MKALNTTTVLFVAVVLFLPANQKALAGSTSALDPYADVQPASKSKVKQHTPKPEQHVKAKAPKKSVEESAYTNERDLEPAPVKEEAAPQVHTPKVVKAPKPEKVTSPKPVVTSEKSAPSAKAEKSAEGHESEKTAAKTPAPKTVQPEGEGVGSGLREIGHGYVKTFKAAGGSFASGAKAVGAKLASGSKIAGSKLSKTGDQLAHGIKEGAGSVGDKVKAGAGAVGDKVKPSKVAKAPKEPKEKAPKEVAEKPAPKEKPLKEVAEKPEKTKKGKAPKAVAYKESEQALDQAKVTTTPAGIPDFSQIGKPLPPVESERTHRVKTGPGVIGKTVGKLNPFAGKKTKTAKVHDIKIQAPRQAAVDMSHPQTD